MNVSNQQRMIVGLDIGTSKVVAIVGEINPEGNFLVVQRLREIHFF